MRKMTIGLSSRPQTVLLLLPSWKVAYWPIIFACSCWFISCFDLLQYVWYTIFFAGKVLSTVCGTGNHLIKTIKMMTNHQPTLSSWKCWVNLLLSWFLRIRQVLLECKYNLVGEWNNYYCTRAIKILVKMSDNMFIRHIYVLWLYSDITLHFNGVFKKIVDSHAIPVEPNCPDKNISILLLLYLF